MIPNFSLLYLLIDWCLVQYISERQMGLVAQTHSHTLCGKCKLKVSNRSLPLEIGEPYRRWEEGW